MSRLTFATPKNYYVFRRIFGSEQRKDVLVAFLNDMLGLDGAHRIVRVELLSPEQRPAVAELELSIVDIQCTDARGVVYVVEMQVLQVEGFEKHIVENVATAHVNQTAQGDGYVNRDDVVGITICDFSLWPDTEAHRLPMLTRWRRTEQQTGAKELGQISSSRSSGPAAASTSSRSTAPRHRRGLVLDRWSARGARAARRHL
jgi:predicted transposase/invertase (TIGR01784 family)